jgi:hypothetical protein
MSRKSTHRGHCQLCGALHKLPGDVLADHGYTVRWGFFQGVCAGAGSLPYEASCGALVSAASSVQADIANLQAEIEVIRAASDGRVSVPILGAAPEGGRSMPSRSRRTPMSRAPSTDTASRR